MYCKLIVTSLANLKALLCFGRPGSIFLKSETLVPTERLEPITPRAEPGLVLPVHDVITYSLSTPLYQIYVHYACRKVGKSY